MAKPVQLPAAGDVEYTYEIVPTGFTEGKWVAMSEIRPSSRQNVHHAVVYVRPPDSPWLRDLPKNVPFTASDMTNEQDRHEGGYPAGLRAGEFAGQLAGGNGEIYSGGERSGASDALHHAWTSDKRSDCGRTSVCEDGAG
jgi:hypothetical protein